MPYDDNAPSSGVIEIPWNRLAADVLDAILEEFVTREGTDYGDYDYSLNDKKEQVLQQLKRGSVRLLFDPDANTCHIQTTDMLKQQGLLDE